MELLAWIESTSFATWVRESGSLWSYPSILFLHTIGLGFLVGTNAAVDLRLLGVASEFPVGPLEKFFPVMWLGFWVNAGSGLALLAADATTKLTNPLFFVKLACIALGMVDMALIRRTVLRSPEPEAVRGRGRLLAVVSLALWVGAITAGRLMAYFGPVSGIGS